VRALVVSNMLPDAAHPERGSFVRDQVAALQRLEGIDVELFEFAPGPRALVRAAADLRRLSRERARVCSSGAAAGSSPASAPAYDVVHAHFGLTAWPAFAVQARVRALTLHGTDLTHPRTRVATCAALPLVNVVATVSTELVAALPRRARARAKVLPCGADVERFVALPRVQARRELGLDADQPYVLFPADPARPEKRHDRALELARDAGAELLALGGVDPERVPLWVNAANAVVVPSEREGFGLAAIEALACDVPVLATPVGIHADALAGIAGTLCAPFELRRWSEALAPHLRSPDPRVEGRERAMRYSAVAMAECVAEAWRAASERDR
jgi:glycosyltransferase involved in cell wall biosynthesis